MKILRRFRYYFLEENNFRKYTLYAIGEVILIVIGILIALQLNNLNEGKIYREREGIYLSEYLNDLSVCKNDLQRTINRTNVHYTYADTLLKLIHSRKSDVDLTEVSKHLINCYHWSTFEGSDGTVTEILNGGNLHLIRNSEIRSSIASWDFSMKDMKSFEVVLKELVQDYYSFLLDYLDIEVADHPDYDPMTDLNRDTLFIYYTQTITQPKWIHLFSQLRFINMVNDIRGRQKHLNGIYLKKEKEIDSLIETVRLELQDFN